jgi:hypothetical protein
LWQVTDARTHGSEHDRALIGLFGADETAQQGRLAGAVRTDQADALTVVEYKRNIRENSRSAIGMAQVLNV